MHIHDAPRREDGLLVRVLEQREYLRNSLHPFRRRQLVCFGRHLTYTQPCRHEHVLVVVFDEVFVHLLRHALWHKFVPRSFVYQVGELLRRDIFFDFYICAIDQQRDPDRQPSQNRDKIFGQLTLFPSLKLFPCRLRSRRTSAVIAALRPTAVKTLTVDVDFVFLFPRSRFTDLRLQLLELLLVLIRQIHEHRFFVQMLVVKTALDDHLGIRLLELTHHTVDVVRLHLRSFHRNDRAECQEFFHLFARTLFAATVLESLCDDRQRPVRSEVEHRTILFLLSVYVCRVLHPENGLQIAARRRRELTGKHEHRRPLRHGHAHGQPSARQCDCIAVVRVLSYRVPHHLQRAAPLLLFVAVSCYIDDFERAGTKDRVLFEQCTERLRLFHPRHHPQGVTIV